MKLIITLLLFLLLGCDRGRPLSNPLRSSEFDNSYDRNPVQITSPTSETKYYPPSTTPLSTVPTPSPSSIPQSSPNPTVEVLPPCPFVAGKYMIGTQEFVVIQRGCRFESIYTIGDFQHILVIDLVGVNGMGDIYRTNLSSGCLTVIRTEAHVLPTGSLEIISTATDGRCDLPVPWAQYARLDPVP